MAKISRKYRKRLSIDLPENIHDELKLAASRKNITMTTYVIRSLIEKLKNEGSLLDILHRNYDA